MNPPARKRTFTVEMTEDRDVGGFVGSCEELHAYSEGDAFGETVENMKEAIDLATEDRPGDFNLLIILN